MGFAGLIGGISGIGWPPTVMYLTAIATAKSEQIRIQGVIYGLGAVALIAAHLGSGVLHSQVLTVSVFLSVFVFSGIGVLPLCTFFAFVVLCSFFFFVVFVIAVLPTVSFFPSVFVVPTIAIFPLFGIIVFVGSVFIGPIFLVVLTSVLVFPRFLVVFGLQISWPLPLLVGILGFLDFVPFLVFCYPIVLGAFVVPFGLVMGLIVFVLLLSFVILLRIALMVLRIIGIGGVVFRSEERRVGKG